MFTYKMVNIYGGLIVGVYRMDQNGLQHVHTCSECSTMILGWWCGSPVFVWGICMPLSQKISKKHQKTILHSHVRKIWFPNHFVHIFAVWRFLFKFCLGARRFRNQSFLTLTDSDSVCVGAMVGSLPMFDILVLSLVLSVLINVVLISACVVKLVCPVSRPLPPPPKPHESGTSPEECERDSTESSVEDSLTRYFSCQKDPCFTHLQIVSTLERKGTRSVSRSVAIVTWEGTWQRKGSSQDFPREI